MATVEFVPVWDTLHRDQTVDEWRRTLAAWVQEDYRRCMPGLPPLSDEAAMVEVIDETPARCEVDCALDQDLECDRVATAVIRKGSSVLWSCSHHSVAARAAGWTHDPQ